MNCLFLVATANQCGNGEQPNTAKTGCEDCPADTYKLTSAAWSDACTSCDSGKNTVGTGSTLEAMCIGEYQTNHVILVAKNI